MFLPPLILNPLLINFDNLLDPPAYFDPPIYYGFLGYYFVEQAYLFALKKSSFLFLEKGWKKGHLEMSKYFKLFSFPSVLSLSYR